MALRIPWMKITLAAVALILLLAGCAANRPVTVNDDPPSAAQEAGSSPLSVSPGASYSGPAGSGTSASGNPAFAPGGGTSGPR